MSQKKHSEQPNYVSHETSQPSNNTRWIKKRSEQPDYQEPSDQTTKNLQYLIKLVNQVITLDESKKTLWTTKLCISWN